MLSAEVNTIRGNHERQTSAKRCGRHKIRGTVGGGKLGWLSGFGAASWIDNSTDPVTVWYVDHEGWIVRIQPLE
jgi:hypothetical protein